MTTTVFFATNRAPVGNATRAPFYGLDATPGKEGVLRTGQAEVTTAAEPEAHREIVAVLPDPVTPRRGGRAAALAPAVAAWRDAALAAREDAALFIHGYANDWSDSIRRAAQLRDFYALPRDRTAKPLSLLAFGWPSDGLVMPPTTHYPADRRDAKTAGPALAALLGQIAQAAVTLRAAGLRLHLIAHSMGNWALRHGVLAYRPAAGAPALFDEALLTAADEDHDALGDTAKLGRLAQIAARITVHVYDFDVILLVAQKLTRTDRLGEEWPVPLPVAAKRNDAALRVGPVITEMSDPNLTGHQYYRNNPAVRRDVIAVLEGQPQAAIRGRAADPARPGHFVLWGATEGDPPVA